jgi:hypothetical protein
MIEHGTEEYSRRQKQLIIELGILCDPLRVSVCWIEKSLVLIEVFKFILEHEYYLTDYYEYPDFCIATLLQQIPRLQNEFNQQISKCNQDQEWLKNEFMQWSSKFREVFIAKSFYPLEI